MENQVLSHPVVCFIADLMFITRVESVVRNLGYEVQTFERVEQVAGSAEDIPHYQRGEHLEGPGADLMELLTDIQPCLVIFDLSNKTIPWKDWIALIKSAPATRRTPVICFGSHIDVQSFHAAKDAGADAVLARSAFVGDMPGIIEKYALMPDYDGLEDACRESLSELAVHGLQLFNRGEFFEAHEALEDAWNADNPPGRELYRAILQVAVAYLQIERRNYNGAKKMFLRLRQWIEPLPDSCRGVDVKQLRQDALAVKAALEVLGPERIGEFNRQLFKPVAYIEFP